VAGRLEEFYRVRLSAAGAWGAVRVVPVVQVVRLIAVRSAGGGRLNHDDGTS
jgi:hypothetical protein